MPRGPDFIVTGTRGAGKAPVGDPPEWTDITTEAELATHVAAADPHTVYQKESEKASASGYAGLDGNVFVPSAQLARYRASVVAVGPSSLAETTLIDQTVPGGLMGTTGILRCRVGGDSLWNLDALGTYTLRVYAGGTKIYDATSAALGQSANRRTVFFDMSFVNRNSAAANQLVGIGGLGNNIAATTGQGAINNTTVSVLVMPLSFSSALQTIDTSVAWAFKVTMQLSESNAAVDMRISSVLLEVL